MCWCKGGHITKNSTRRRNADIFLRGGGGSQVLPVLYSSTCQNLSPKRRYFQLKYKNGFFIKLNYKPLSFSEKKPISIKLSF